MKRKYYLRGLGIGILVTALVFTFTGPKKMSDEDIIKRAEELGYVKEQDKKTEPTILKDLLGTGTPTPSPVPTIVVTPEPTDVDVPEAPEATITPTVTVTVTPTPTEAPVETPEPTREITPTLVPTATVAPTPTIRPTKAPTPTMSPAPTSNPEEEVITATISVEPGNTAKAVCKKIEAAGIVKDGEALKNYIVRNQMADFINVGTYTLSSDMTYEEIAKILTER